MSISIVVPVWRRDVYERVALPWIQYEVDQGAELVEVAGDSILEAYESGRQKASHDVILYVHDDARLIWPTSITHDAVQAFENVPDLGLIGPYGRGIEPSVLPWWHDEGPWVGHYLQDRYRYAQNGRMRVTRFFRGQSLWNRWCTAAFVDGFCLIEHRGRLNVPWDTESFPGQWHGYDVDRCMQAHELRLQVVVSPWLWQHDNGGHAGYKGTDPKPNPTTDEKGRMAQTEGDALWLSDLDRVNDQLRQKWGLERAKDDLAG